MDFRCYGSSVRCRCQMMIDHEVTNVMEEFQSRTRGVWSTERRPALDRQHIARQTKW